MVSLILCEILVLFFLNLKFFDEKYNLINKQNKFKQLKELMFLYENNLSCLKSL